MANFNNIKKVVKINKKTFTSGFDENIIEFVSFKFKYCGKTYNAKITKNDDLGEISITRKNKEINEIKFNSNKITSLKNEEMFTTGCDLYFKYKDSGITSRLTKFELNQLYDLLKVMKKD